MPDLENLLAEHVEEAFETAAFIVPERTGEPPAPADNWLTVAVDFEGDVAGRLVLCAEPSLVSALAGNMLGVEEEELPLDRQVDALKEMANIICGNLFAQEEFRGAEVTILSPVQEREPRLRSDLPGGREVRAGFEDVMEGRMLALLQVRAPVREGSSA